jgi:paraquat-inducible protein B
VLLRGVRVGYVQLIQLQGRINEKAGTFDTLVEVVMEVDPASFTLFAEGQELDEEGFARIPTAEYVDAGFRAQLGIESYVTGQLLIELDFKPGTEAVFRGERPRYPEVPTVPSDVQRALAGVQDFITRLSNEIDVAQLLRDIQGTAAGLNALANSEDLRAALAGMNRITTTEAPTLVRSLDASAAELHSLLGDSRALVQRIDAQIDPIAAELVPALERMQGVLAASQTTLEIASRQMRSDSEIAVEVRTTLEELQGAARALRVLLDYVDRHPEALLRGKGGS